MSKRPDYEFARIASEIQIHTDALTIMTETDMGHLTEKLAKKFIKAVELLQSVDRTLRATLAEYDRIKDETGE